MSYFSSVWKTSSETASQALKNRSLFEKIQILFYIIGAFLGKLFIFTRPFFDIADYNIAHMMDSTYNFSLSKAFEGALNKDKYWQMIGAYLVRDAYIIGSLFVFALPIVLFWFGVGHNSRALIPGLLVSIPFAIAAIIFAVYFLVDYYPIAYVAKESRGLDASDYLYNAKHSLNKSQKRSVFGLLALPLLIAILYYIIVAVIGIILFNFDSAIIQVIGLVFMVVGFAVSIFFIPKLYFVKINALFVLFKDKIKIEKVLVVAPNPGGNTYSPIIVDKVPEEKIYTIEEIDHPEGYVKKDHSHDVTDGPRFADPIINEKPKKEKKVKAKKDDKNVKENEETYASPAVNELREEEEN